MLAAVGVGDEDVQRSRLQRERLSTSSESINSWTHRMWRTAVRVRLVSTLSLSLALGLIPAFGDHRIQLALLAAVMGTLYIGLLDVFFRRTRAVPQFMALSDTALILLFPVIQPRTFVPCTLIVMSSIALIAATVGVRKGLAAAALGTVGFALEALLIHPVFATEAVCAFAVTSVSLSISVGKLAQDAFATRVRLASLVEDLHGIVWESDPGSMGFTYVSPQAEAILGYPAEQWYEDGFWPDHLHPDDRDEAIAFCREAEEGRRSHELEYRMIAADGRVVHLHDVVAVTPDASGRSYTVHGVMLDVSDRKGIEQRVRQYAEIVEAIGIGLVVLTLDDPEDELSLRLVAANPAACEAVGRPLEQWAGRKLHEALPIVFETDIPRQVMGVIKTGRPCEMDDIVVRAAQPTEAIYATRAFPLSDNTIGVSLDDVTATALASQALRRQALHDGLTGLPNRTLLQDRLTHSLHESSRTGEPIALLVMDLDQFKEINDALGHHVGDLLLIELAHRLQRLVRSADVLSRLGGDEFALLMTTDVTEIGAVRMAERVNTSLLEPFVVGELRLQTNVSIGIALSPQHGSDAESLTQRADVAMYQAKRSGSGHSLYKAELDRSSVRRLTLLGELRRALDADEFVLHFQPIVSVATGEVVRAEALVRWNHPEQGLLQPNDFIDLAEVSGFIQPLTRWVVERAAATAVTWWPAGHKVGIAVNLSVRNLYDPDLPSHVARVLNATGLPAQLLMLEVTESELMDDPTLALEVLTAINQLGVATGVDDFGTGYSSLTYLRNLPIREIKIDQSFVSGMSASADDLTIVRSTIDLGHNLSLDVVAEGVEDPLTLMRLGTLGCDLAQGFHLSPPLPASQFREWLDEHRAKAAHLRSSLSGPGAGAGRDAAPERPRTLESDPDRM